MLDPAIEPTIKPAVPPPTRAQHTITPQIWRSSPITLPDASFFSCFTNKFSVLCSVLLSAKFSLATIRPVTGERGIASGMLPIIWSSVLHRHRCTYSPRCLASLRTVLQASAPCVRIHPLDLTTIHLVVVTLDQVRCIAFDLPVLSFKAELWNVRFKVGVALAPTDTPDV